MTVDEQLDQLAVKLEPTKYREGEATIGPDEGQDLESFQADVRRLRRYAEKGLLEIRSEHQETGSGNRYIDRVRVRMGPEGIAWRKELRSN
jgi:hypothetical protein